MSAITGACQCGEVLRLANARLGVEVHVQRLPAVSRAHPDFPPFIATCPHGIAWMSEPTDAQLAQWAKDKTP